MQVCFTVVDLSCLKTWLLMYLFTTEMNVIFHQVFKVTGFCTLIRFVQNLLLPLCSLFGGCFLLAVCNLVLTQFVLCCFICWDFCVFVFFFKLAN